MLRSAASKVMWVGRATVFSVGLAVMLAVVFGMASAAFGANDVNFILGRTNVATIITRLAGPEGVNGAMFEVQNNDAATNDTALSLKVQEGEPPMEVNSATRVTNLNADRLDGKHAGAFLPNATYRKFEGTSGTPVGGGHQLANIECDEGDVLLSGGYGSVDAGTTVSASQPVDAKRWELVWINDGTADQVVVTIFCADFAPLHTP